MSLFNCEQAGVGIPKNAPKKKPFFAFMDIFLSKFWKLIQLNLINALFLVPLFLTVILFFSVNDSRKIPVCVFLLVVQAMLIGPSTAGMVRVLRNFTQHKLTFVWSDYLRAVKSNFKPAVFVGFVDSLLAVSVATGIYVYPNMIAAYDNKLFYVPFVLTFSIATIVIMINFYAFLLLVSTNVSFGGILRTSLSLAFLAFKRNLLTLLIGAVTWGLFAFVSAANFYFLILLPILPVSQFWLVVTFRSYPMIQKYVINPYYEQRGEKNPELLEGENAETLFEDKGGQEAPIAAKKRKNKGKVIS